MIVPNYKKQTFWQGALLLTIAGLLTKILSAVYRVPYQNIAGDIGFYIYQQVYPFYGIAIALSLYGFPVVISKLLPELREERKISEPLILICSFFSLLIFSVIIFLLLFGFSTPIAVSMGDKNLVIPIKMVSFTFLLLPMISIFRGYFQGQENMLPTALSQIAEQTIRVGTILILAYFLVLGGYTSYEVGTGAVFGSITGGFAALAVLLGFKRSIFSNLTKRSYLSIISLNQIRIFPFKRVILSSLAVCTTGLTLVLLQLVDSFTLYSFLLSSGHDETLAKVEKGVFDRGQPLIQLGVVLATSLSLSLVPTISKAVLEHNHIEVSKKSSIALKISLIVGCGAMFGLISIIKYTNIMLFTNSAGTKVLSVLSVSILFLSISLTSAAILQGLGFITLTSLFVLVGVLIKWVLNGLLIPVYEVTGAAIATVAAVGVIMLLTSALLFWKLGYDSIPKVTFFLKTILAGTGMFIVLKGYERIYFYLFGFQDENRIISSIYTLSAVLLGAMVFVFLIFVLKIVEKEELSQWMSHKEHS